MVETEKVRVDESFKDKIYDIKARYMGRGIKPPTTADITKMFAKYLDCEKIFQNEHTKK